MIKYSDRERPGLVRKTSARRAGGRGFKSRRC
jgi:hypothetical protein